MPIQGPYQGRLSINIKQTVEIDVYGQYVVITMHDLKSKSIRSFAEFQINNILCRKSAIVSKNTTGLIDHSVASTASTAHLVLHDVIQTVNQTQKIIRKIQTLHRFKLFCNK